MSGYASAMKNSCAYVTTTFCVIVTTTFFVSVPMVACKDYSDEDDFQCGSSGGSILVGSDVLFIRVDDGRTFEIGLHRKI